MMSFSCSSSFLILNNPRQDLQAQEDASCQGQRKGDLA